MPESDDTTQGHSPAPATVVSQRALVGAVVVLAVMTSLFVVALPVLNATVVGAAVLVALVGAGASTLFLLSRS